MIWNTIRVYLTAAWSTCLWAYRILTAARHPDRPGSREILERGPIRWARPLLTSARVEVVVEGAEKIPDGMAAVLVANHQSWYDVFAMLVHLPFKMRWVGKKELVKVPLFGPSWLACGNIPIDRSDRRAAIRSLELAGETLRREGAMIIMFPEGTRSDGGEMLPFKKGAFMLALQLGVPIVPVGVSGSREVMPKGSLTVRPGTVTVRVGDPISVEGRSLSDRDELMLEARDAIERLRAPRQLKSENQEPV